MYQILKYDYMLGIQYSFNLVIFTLTSALSLTTPLIVPFGKYNQLLVAAAILTLIFIRCIIFWC